MESVTQSLICKTDDVCLTELPAFVLSGTAKQTAPCQSAGDEPQTSLHAGGWMVEKKTGIRNEVAILSSRGQVWAG